MVTHKQGWHPNSGETIACSNKGLKFQGTLNLSEEQLQDTLKGDRAT